MSDSGDFVATLRRALDESSFHAARGQRPPARLVQGSPGHIWDVITNLLLTEAKAEYLGLDDPLYLRKAKARDSLVVRGSRTMQGLVDRGVRTLQVSTLAGFQVDEDSSPMLQWRRGGAARLVHQLPTKACIIDRRFAFVPTDLAVLAHGMTITTDPAVVSILVAAHHALWWTGVDPHAGLDGPPPHLRSVLSTLSSGLPDDRAAQRSGLSPRTYSRRVAELTQLLGVSSRFEAGAEAARRGWV